MAKGEIFVEHEVTELRAVSQADFSVEAYADPLQSTPGDMVFRGSGAFALEGTTLHVAAEVPKETDLDWTKMGKAGASGRMALRVGLAVGTKLQEVDFSDCHSSAMTLRSLAIGHLVVDRTTHGEKSNHAIKLEDVSVGTLAAHLVGGSFKANGLEVRASGLIVAHNPSVLSISGPETPGSAEIVTRIGATCAANCLQDALGVTTS